MQFLTKKKVSGNVAFVHGSMFASSSWVEWGWLNSFSPVLSSQWLIMFLSLFCWVIFWVLSLVLIEPVCWSQDCVGLYLNMFSDQSGEHDLWRQWSCHWVCLWRYEELQASQQPQEEQEEEDEEDDLQRETQDSHLAPPQHLGRDAEGQGGHDVDQERFVGCS